MLAFLLSLSLAWSLLFFASHPPLKGSNHLRWFHRYMAGAFVSPLLGVPMVLWLPRRFVTGSITHHSQYLHIVIDSVRL